MNHGHAARCRGDDASRSVQSRRVTPGGALWRRPVSLGAGVALMSVDCACPISGKAGPHQSGRRGGRNSSGTYIRFRGVLNFLEKKKQREESTMCAGSMVGRLYLHLSSQIHYHI